MKLAGRWFLIVIALWSTCTVWQSDKFATTESHKGLYWSIVAFIAAVALIFEIRDLFKKQSDEA